MQYDKSVDLIKFSDDMKDAFAAAEFKNIDQEKEISLIKTDCDILQ